MLGWPVGFTLVLTMAWAWAVAGAASSAKAISGESNKNFISEDKKQESTALEHRATVE